MNHKYPLIDVPDPEEMLQTIALPESVKKISTEVICANQNIYRI